ncbi:MAG: DUF429 domain-containing protein [Anaerolineae bacterium]
MNYIGVDGCKNGWFYVGLDDRDNWETGITPNIQHLIDRFREACLILVDIPIGLREKEQLERLCDKKARKVLGPKRAPSVFPAPCRAAVYASCYEEASRINQELTGRHLSKQSWAISSKIRQVDLLLRASEAARTLVREVHPEICFWGLNEGRSMTHSKRTPEGFVERLGVIRKVYGRCEELVKEALLKHEGQDVARDDVLDALAAAVTAKFGFDVLKTLPEAPERDSVGLPMEMVYYNPHLGKAIIRRWIEECYNKGNLAVADELVATDYVNHSAPLGQAPGLESEKQYAAMIRSAYPDFYMAIEDQIAEGDKVVTRYTARGTHKGEFLGIPPTGKQITVAGIHIHRIVGGKVVEGWSEFDQLGALQQLGVVPPIGAGRG